MEENNILISVSLTLSILFNVFSYVITRDMSNNKDNWCVCWGEYEPLNNKPTPLQKTLAVITLIIGLFSLSCWGAALGLDNHVGLTDSSPNTQTLYSLGTIGAFSIVIWIVFTAKYWLCKNR